VYFTFFVYAVFGAFSSVVCGEAASPTKPWLTRDALVAAAIEGHPDVRAAEQAWVAARGQHLQSSMLPDPEFEVEFEELPSAFDLGQFGERTVAITQTVENPIKWFYRSRSTKHITEAVRYSVYEMTRLRVATRAKVAFDRVLADQMILASTHKHLALSEGLRDRARVRFKAGDVPRLELLRAEVEATRGLNRLTEAEMGLAVSRAVLAELAGQEIPPRVEGQLLSEVAMIDLKRLHQLSRQNRPDLLGSEQVLASTRSSRSAAVASWVPDVSLSLGRQTIDGGGSRSSSWKASVGFAIPLWAPFRQRGQLMEAAADGARADAELESLVRSTRMEVESAYLAYQMSHKRIILFDERILSLATESHRVARESYEQGKATYLELLAAQQTLNTSRINRVEALFSYQQAIAELEFSVGTDLSTQEAAR
jgi:cobalt-zinc-cadmium efflux system outer membrane protein